MTAVYKFSDIYWNAESSTGYSSYKDALDETNPIFVVPGNVGRLLSVLCLSYPRFVTNRELKQRVWNHEYLSDESVTQLIKRARDLLNDDNKTVLVNTKGKGYRLQVKAVDALEENDIPVVSKAVEAIENIEDSKSEIDIAVAPAQENKLIKPIFILVLFNTLYNIAHFLGFAP